MVGDSGSAAAKIDELARLISDVAARTPAEHDASPTASGKRGAAPSGRASEVASAKEIALRRVDRRDHSRGELTDYLVRKRQLDPGIVAEILDRFVEVGIVDDARFARNWAQERARTRRLSRRAISRELSVRGVSEELIEIALDQISPDDERQAALELCRIKARRLHGVDRQVALRRLSGQLARRGYSTGVAMPVIFQVLDELAE
ncbi:regulatory protein RecX [Propionibacterium freudenreichii]|uniref:regulatory protein RecX n=1 Tax=Propionibacterium freudenreichii TaxID=1744 RepID=UPI0021A7B320|nr:regulatory protein RecX [Propionibacterium freudenreichii]MDK9649997.1 regulatory protein RecX [Propionibacterium freudenreichii]MDK9664094.1 regulatory protein RecX [Propionibacterium freudenreichii]